MSIGIRIPIRLVRTRGRKQYPSTLAERGNVKVDEKWPADGGGPLGFGWEWKPSGLIAASGTPAAGESRVGDMRLRITCRAMVPKTATP